MALAAGTRLGPYEILGLIGAGGMGEVYKARDIRLDRIVAIKVLPPHLSDPEHRARLEREARTIAGLSHRHICALYDVGEHASSTFLVMEHLAGETLAERLRKGPLPIDQALEFGAQIADALSTAHRHGVIHRDLKPANVMLTRSGATLLDFGLAKLRPEEGVHVAVDSSVAVTGIRDVTSTGTLVGTLPYMAPEQVEGREPDHRTDIWAMGCVLYEMVTGEPAFTGTTAGSLVGAILAREPASLAARQPLAPPAMERLVRRCLAKDPDERWESAHDVADELKWIRETRAAGAPVIPTDRPTRRRSGIVILAGLLLLILATAVVAWFVRPSVPIQHIARLTLELRPAEELSGGASFPRYAPTNGGSRTALAWTPDGQSLVFVGQRAGVRQIYVRRLQDPEAHLVPNTEGATTPAISTDARWVAFWANGMIRKVPLAGGPAMDLARVELPWGMTWDARGNLFVGREGAPILRIPAEGTPSPATEMGETEVMHSLPSTLPDSRTLLYTVRKRIWSWGDEQIVAQDLATGERRVVLQDAADARYVPSGHLVFLRRGVLFAVPFDPDRVEVRGKEVAVLEPVAQGLVGTNNGDVTGAGQFAVSAPGTLAWVPGSIAPQPSRALVTVDRTGELTELAAPERAYGGLHLSPDGMHLAFSVNDVNDVGLWVYDLERGALTAVNRDGEVMWPIWSPDGQRIVFRWLKNGRFALASQPADGSAPPAVLSDGFFFPSSFSPNGREVVALRGRGDHGIVTVRLGPPASVQSVIETPDEEAWPELSPDGLWLAYVSNRSGRFEVYVRSASDPGSAETVSVDGGESPAWDPRGRELYFLSPPDRAGTRRLMATEITWGPPLRFARPRALFEIDESLRFGCLPVRCYGVAPDGQRFYAMQARWPSPANPVAHVNVVLNWFEELKTKVPSR